MRVEHHPRFSDEELDVMESTVLAAKRLFDAQFTDTLTRLTHWRITRYERRGGELIRTDSYHHDDFEVEHFEAFAMRLRPFWFNRDACAMEERVMPLLQRMANSNESAKCHVGEAEKFWSCEDIRQGIAGRTPTEIRKRTGATDTFDIVFGGSDWLDETFFDEVFLYGGFYHWNANGGKWRLYQQIEARAGGYKNVVASVLPFFRRKLYAIVRVAKVFEEQLRREGKLGDWDGVPSYLWVMSHDESQDPRKPHNLVMVERSSTETKLSSGADVQMTSPQPAPVLDILALVHKLSEGEFLEERMSLFICNGDLKFRMRIQSNLDPSLVTLGAA